MYNLDWETENANRKYPFTKESTLISNEGFELTNDVIVDIFFSLNKHYDLFMYLSKIIKTPEYCYVQFGISGVTDNACSGTLIPLSNNSYIRLEGAGEYASSFGTVVIHNIDNLPNSEFNFSESSNLIEPCRVIKLSSGISSINGISSGNILLKSNSNVKITVIGNTIYIDTIDGLCVCNTEGIKTINSIPHVNQNFKIEGVGCIQVDATDSGIVVSNICEQACCGCDEINDFIDRMNLLEKRIALLE